MSPSPDSNGRQVGRRAATGGLAAVALLAVAGGSALGRHAAEHLDRRAVPAAAFGSQRLRGALTAAGLLHLQPVRSGAADPHGGGRCPDAPIGVEPLLPEAMPSSRLPAGYTRRGAVVSLALDDCRLERLRAHPLEHGRDAEETGWISFYERGELRFASAVGVRLHGGNDRAGKRSRRGYRLYFRSVYGEPGFPGPLLSTDLGAPVARLVLRYDRARDRTGLPWFFAQPLAFDLARRLGGETPRTRPAWLVVNGEPEQVVALTEHISPDLVRRRFGHADFDLLRAKGEREPDEELLWQAELAWLERQARPLTAETVAARYDVDALTDWLVVNAFCATGDTFQPTLARDRRGVAHAGRWFPIHWDMDLSFFEVSRRERWRREQDPLALVLDRRNHPRLLVGRVLHRLLTEDQDYRAAFAERLERALGRDLAASFLAERLAAYERAAAELELADRRFFADLERFLTARPDVLRTESATLLGQTRRAAARVRNGPYQDPSQVP